MKKQKDNYLEKIPYHKAGLDWSQDKNGIVTLQMENCGVMNRIAQILLKKPKISYIHLEEFGSFIWLQIDGERNITEIGRLVRSQFGKSAEPLYERLAQYIKTLNSNGFIDFV